MQNHVYPISTEICMFNIKVEKCNCRVGSVVTFKCNIISISLE